MMKLRAVLMVGVLMTIAASPAAHAATRPSYQYEVLAQLGTRAAGGGTLRGGFEPAAIGRESDVLYVAGIGSRGAEGLFLDTLDAIITIATPGQEAADGWRFAEQPGVLGGIGGSVAMNGAGDIAFAADLSRDGERGTGVFQWERATGSLRAVVLPGAPAPGGAAFGEVRPGVALDPSGAVIFAAQPMGTASNGQPRAEGLLRSQDGDTRPLVMPGDAEPGGGTFLRASQPSANDAERIAFIGEVRRNGRSVTGFFIVDGPRILSLVEVGAPAPGGEPLRAIREPRLDGSGDGVFFGDTGEWSVYRADEGGLTRLVGPGMPLPDGGRVGSVATSAGSLSIARDAAALVLYLEDHGAPGVFLHGPGGLAPVALPGTFLAGVGPVDAMGEVVAGNDAGQVAFQAELADGEVVLVLATPAPSGG